MSELRASALVPLDLPDATLAFAPQWLDAAGADALFADCLAQVPWRVHRIRMFGRDVDSPRRSCWMGEPDATYTYSRTRFVPEPWTPVLAGLRDAVALACGTRFNSVLANLYRDGHDSMGWHSDNEPELGPTPIIASVSLGATRRFVLRARANPALKYTLDLPHGSLLVMAGDTQRSFQHALPRALRVRQARINLTFRQVTPI